ncbi:Chemotaxis protein CheW [bioreactor metagenome]|uniref:Chemotaxis protein CheW n=1 Tax=bioreactor metagenome TaxID=1076179 RepID=A0A645AYW0_9ZZZZ|nr:chemotaxis protein CheW [Lutispora sp.]MEA4962742.1 chemotaxis protein CheW [Lutispora sp.]HCJ56420.1 chemotaxis protein CheW [Clostridiaceae bacterium]
MNYTDKNNQFVVFELDNEEYGIDILRVKTIEKMSNITRVPKTALYIKGVINLRGEIVPIIDLREKFNLDKKEESENTRIIIVYVDDINVGLIVDSASKVIEISNDMIELPPESLGNTEQNNIYGIGKVDDKIITLLDVKKLLNV